MPESFKKALNYDKKPVEEVKKFIFINNLIFIIKLPYIVGYKGFRRGVKSGNYYGKNFSEVSTNSMNATNNILVPKN